MTRRPRGFAFPGLAPSRGERGPSTLLAGSPTNLSSNGLQLASLGSIITCGFPAKKVESLRHLYKRRLLVAQQLPCLLPC
jgi:hypothetical protein